MTVHRLEVSFESGSSVAVQLMRGDGCVHVWLSSGDNERGGSHCSLNNVVTGIQTAYDSMPLSRPLLSTETEDDDDLATQLAQRLAKRLKMQVFVSCSLSPKFALLSSVERQIVSYLEEDS